jgi:hypothetical protein
MEDHTLCQPQGRGQAAGGGVEPPGNAKALRLAEHTVNTAPRAGIADETKQSTWGTL